MKLTEDQIAALIIILAACGIITSIFYVMYVEPTSSNMDFGVEGKTAIVILACVACGFFIFVGCMFLFGEIKSEHHGLGKGRVGTWSNKHIGGTRKGI